ncbi:hypothetical protein SEA_KINGBOB_38 [Arthrobacter phage KingBob]|uniref:Uncharacterized protein n=1 Tax=Arthrobacter phage Sergei TaxID=2250416 RepID=A0A345KPX6_9CAUD|nr:hypothetical protein KDJ06_gp38 [Arthrobacter phage Sergei]ASZ74352.1 hypothetical protein TEMPER16_38 [Arthrobacter phage Temper16]AXH43965.1 hypothetical protein SEA_DAIBOJU_38 [Arthrobacter phage Daiboju]AXH44027.1 hypothetical protein SEA_HERB_38 [Arthrobacter phage Herb]AXH44271.1 hypothetical protein SEA_KINGBOB_38 [Arthrobacter phage KingBob]QGJ97178.1 hypothetical protein SEA_MARIA1952_37 [Arthrobacter phage Maria1952]
MPKLIKHRIAATVIENADPKDLGYIAGQLIAANLALNLGTPKAAVVANFKKTAEQEEAKLAADSDR